MDTNAAEYKLSAQLEGHFGVVRHIEAIPGGMFASSSRDCTVRIWKLVNGQEWGLFNLLNPHKQLADKAGIACSHYIPPNTNGFPNGALVTGGYDHVLFVSNIETSEIYQTLVGHTDAVVSVIHLPNGDIVSGSSDNMIIVWRNGNIFKKITAHTSIVWALTTLPNGDFVSGSSDQTIKIWRDYNCIKTIKPRGYVRGLTPVPGLGFLSCGSPDTLQLWSYDGELLFDLVGHKHTVYGVSVNALTGEIVSSSEDCSVGVWNGAEMVQSLATPTGVWSVAVLDNGDIVTACQDNKVRVFTRDPTRHVTDEVMTAYMEDVMVAAAAFEEASVSKKQVVNGVQWDHVIQVDLEENQPTIPLGYNDNERPVDVAERFVTEHGISIAYMDQITQFVQNTMAQNQQYNTRPNAPYIDPFRDTEVPSQFGSNLIPTSVGGGSNKQRTPYQQQSSRAPVTMPGTSGGKLFPSIAPITVETGKTDQIINKFKQLNNDSPPEKKLNDDQLKQLEKTAAKIGPSLGSTQVQFDMEEVNNIVQAMGIVPDESRFPLLDLCRLGILYPNFAQLIQPVLLDIVKFELDSSAPVLCQLMALRVFLNAFKLPVFHKSLTNHTEFVLENIGHLIASTNASIPGLAVSLIRNYATHIATTKFDTRTQLLNLVTEEVILNANIPAGLLYLGLYSAGTLMEHDSTLILVAAEMGLKEAIGLLQSNTDANVKTAVQNLGKLFSGGNK